MIDTLEIRSTAGCEIRTDAGRPPSIVGYAAVFDQPSVDLGGFTETVRRGAFTATLAAGTDVVALASHDPSRPLGRRSTGTLDVAEDARGLAVTITPPATSAGRDAIEEVRSGLVAGMSFRFRVRPNGERWTFAGTAGGPFADHRELIDVDLVEVGPTVLPAYPDTTAAVRWQAAAVSGLAEFPEIQIEHLQPLRRLHDLGRRA